MEKFNFNPFDKVLVRNSNSDIWLAALYSHRDREGEKIYTTSGNSYKYWLNFENNSQLLGTSERICSWDDEIKGGEFCYLLHELCSGDKDYFIIKEYGNTFCDCFASFIESGTKIVFNSSFKITRGNDISLDKIYTGSDSDVFGIANEEDVNYMHKALRKAGYLWDPKKQIFVSDKTWELEDGDILAFDIQLPTERYPYTEFFYFRKNSIHDKTPRCIAAWGYHSSLETCSEGSIAYPDISEMRIATPYEINEFMYALSNEGLTIDPVSHNVISNWPKQGDTVFFVNASGEIISREFTNDSFFKELVKIGNAFRNAEDAKPYAEKIKKVFEEKR